MRRQAKQVRAASQWQDCSGVNNTDELLRSQGGASWAEYDVTCTWLWIAMYHLS